VENFKYTEPVAIAVLFVTLALHVLGYNHLVDTLLAGVAAGYLGVDLYQKREK
jgi:hypothetical protein